MKYADGVTEAQLGDRIRLANGDEATVVDFTGILVRTDRGALVQKNEDAVEGIVFLRRIAPPR